MRNTLLGMLCLCTFVSFAGCFGPNTPSRCYTHEDCQEGERCHATKGCITIEKSEPTTDHSTTNHNTAKDPSNACPTTCQEDEIRCEHDYMIVCKRSSENCFAWSKPHPCPNGGICRNNQCSGRCTSNLDCPSGEVCREGQCEACPTTCKVGTTTCKEGKVATCTSSDGCDQYVLSSCPSGQLCQAGSCRTVCQSDSNCGVNQLCKQGFCVSNPSCRQVCSTKGEKKCSASGKETLVCQQSGSCLVWKTTSCPGNQTCTKGTCTSSCSTSSDCPDSQLCVRGECKQCDFCSPHATKCEGGKKLICQKTTVCSRWVESPCSKGQICSNGQCVAGCSQDKECAVGQVCIDQTCQACKKECTLGEVRCQGQDVQVCEGNGSCSHWATDKTCKGRDVCQQGKCIFQCKADSDCPTGLRCKQGSCHGWAAMVGSKGHEAIQDTFIDSKGSIYSTGVYKGSDLTIDGKKQRSPSFQDFFVSKRDSQGKILWWKSFPSTLGTNSSQVVVSDSGNVFVIGTYSGTLTFVESGWIGSKKVTSQGGQDIFILKLDSNGKYLWHRQFGSHAPSKGNSIALDKSENIYITGSFTGSMEIKGNSWRHPLGVDIKSKGSDDIFVIRINDGGTVDWGVNLGSHKRDEGIDLRISQDNFLYVLATYEGDIHLGKTHKFEGTISTVLVKLSPTTGKTLDSQSFTTDDGVLGKKLLLTTNKDIFIAGYFRGSGSFANQSFQSNGGNDAFVLKIGHQSTDSFIKTFGSHSADSFSDIKQDSDGHLLLAGNFSNTPTVSGSKLTNHGKTDIWLMKLKNDGTSIWTKTFGSKEKDAAAALSVDQHNNIVLVGNFEGALTIGKNVMQSKGEQDYFFIYIGKNGELP